ncbi:MAG: efflux transporter outer membrane subunit [Thermodesulfobacteriota bacterium]
MTRQRSHPFWIKLLTAAACLCLASCITVGPDYTAPAPETPTAWDRLDPGDRPAALADATGDLGQWWQRLNDPLLSELVEEVLRSSPDLAIARARLREARARRTAASADLFPEVSAAGSARQSRSSEEVGSGDTSEFYSAGFDAGWELDVFGGTRRSIEAAEADLAAAAAGLDHTRVSLAAETAIGYIQTRSLQNRIAIARDNLASQSETLQLTEWRARAGLVSELDVEQARGNCEQIRARIPSLEISLAETGHALDILLGHLPGTMRRRLAAAGALPEPPADVAVGIPADTLRQRPDVRAAERTLAAETARTGLAEAARYPSFHLSGSIGLEALHFSSLGNSGADASSLLAGITVPIFDAGRLRSQVEAQDAVREQAQIKYEQAVRNALQEVENALVALAGNRDRVRALTAADQAARSAAGMTRQRYSAGLTDFQSVLDTERTALAVEESLAIARADGLLALIRLYKALGGGWPAPDLQSTGKETP